VGGLRFLNGVRRTSDVATAAVAQLDAAAAATRATQAAVAARVQAAATTPAAPPFANPAIAQIAQNAALSTTVTPSITTAPANATPAATTAPVVATPVAATAGVMASNATAAAAVPPSPSASVLYGDSGEMVQAYGAVALIEPPLAFAPIYVRPAVPAIPPVVPASRIPRIAPTS
jgi:hypothetical protein